MAVTSSSVKAELVEGVSGIWRAYAEAKTDGSVQRGALDTGGDGSSAKA